MPEATTKARARRWNWVVNTFSVLLTLAGLGCGPTTYQGFCEQSVSAQCRQFFRCQPDAKTVYTDVPACETDLRARSKCSSLVTDCTLDGNKTSVCINDIEQAACSSATFSLPASCAQLQCAASAGTVTCRSDSGSAGSSTCTRTLSGCTDSNTYGLNCTNAGECTCLKNMVETATFSLATACQDLKSLLGPKCGFPFK